MDVLNRGTVVGCLEDAMPDMWYLEGRFTPADSPAGKRFVEAASALDLKAAYKDHTQAIRALLQESPQCSGILFIVLSLSEDRLFGRRVFEHAAVEWAVANVPE